MLGTRGRRASRQWPWLLLAALLVSVGAPLLGSGAFTKAATRGLPERVVQQRAHVTSLQSAGLPETGQQRSARRSLGDAIELIAAAWAAIVGSFWLARRALAPPRPSGVVLRAPERGPPALQIAV